MSYRTECMEFAAVVASDFPEPVCAARVAGLLIRDAKVIQRHCVNACNREVTSQETARAMQAEHRMRKVLANYPGVELVVGGDPRGYCCKLLLPSKRYNTWGGAESGYGVPVGNI